jgi:glycosyltransferase involved in cell wall biosynthesis
MFARVRDLVRERKAQVVHFHNTFPLISPAAYYGARSAGAAVVQTLHNYRLACPNGLLLREGRPCEACVGGRVAWRAVAHACYRGDRAASAATAAMAAAHRLARTWHRAVDEYVALSAFAKGIFCRAGLPPERITVKPNFVQHDPGPGEGAGDAHGPYALFVGRLDEAKGIGTLLEAWPLLTSAARLKVVGDGPLAETVGTAARAAPAIEHLGPQPADRVAALMASARLLVVPSLCYEGFPKVVAEAFAAGTPVATSDLGSLTELVDHGRTGVHFRPGDARSLAAAVDTLWGDGARLARMRRAARSEFESKYTAERNYQMLTSVYASALEWRHRRRGAAAEDVAASGVAAEEVDPSLAPAP